jgi:hypothetical protein
MPISNTISQADLVEEELLRLPVLTFEVELRPPTLILTRTLTLTLTPNTEPNPKLNP